MPKIHRTAVFSIHQPTKHLRAVFDQALRTYTHAFYSLLHHFASYTAEALRAMATYGVDEEGHSLLSDKRFVRHIFPHAQRYQLKGGMRESVCFDVADAILSYLALLASPKQDSPPSYPGSLRLADMEPARLEALEELAALADNRTVENTLPAAATRVDHKALVPILFARVDTDRQCGLFYNAATRRYYCRLFLLPLNARLARPLTIAGRYQDIKTGKMYACEQEAKGQADITSFGKGACSILAPLERVDRDWHGRSPARQAAERWCYREPWGYPPREMVVSYSSLGLYPLLLSAPSPNMRCVPRPQRRQAATITPSSSPA